MKEFSHYLKSTIPTLEKLIKELLKKYEYASVLGVDSVGKTYRVMTTQTNINDNFFFERGFVLRVHNGINYAEYSFNEISKNDIDKIVKIVDDQLVLKESFKKSKIIQTKKFGLLEEEKLTQDFARVYKNKELTPEEIIKKLETLNNKIIKKENVVNAISRFQNLDISKVFISKNRHLTQYYSWFVGQMFIIVNDGKSSNQYYEACSDVEPNAVFKYLNDHYEEAAQNANDLLHSTPIKPGTYDCIVAPDITGLIAHEAFGHGVEMDMFVKGRAKATEYIGKRVASDEVTMHEAAKGNLQASSYFFDDEGTLAHDTIEIKNGILQTGICDAISALELGVEPTGNGKRQTFERKAYTRMTSTYFEPGNCSVDEMIKSIKHGYYLTGAYSGMEDPKNWGIQCAAVLGREIKDGKFTGKVVSPIMLTGYVPDLLGSISMRSNEEYLCGSGMCGKGYKEWVKTVDGGPHLKVRVNVG